MEVVTQILGGDASAASLLLIFIIMLLTKRVVPWYVHQEVLDKLAKYESTAPDLISEINALMDIVANKEKKGALPTRNPARPQRSSQTRVSRARLINTRAKD